MSLQAVISILDEWIALLSDPCSYQRGRLEKLIDARNRAAEDPRLVKPLLLNSGIWGGMGSFVDSAIFDPFYSAPTSADVRLRAEQWQQVHRSGDKWQRQLNRTTMRLGHALTDFCRARGELEEDESRMVERWMDFAKKCNSRPFEPLSETQIETLESNLVFFENRPGR